MQKLNKLAIYGCICASTIFAVCILANNVKQDKIKHQNIVIDSLSKQIDTMATQVKQLQLDYADMQVAISDLLKWEYLGTYRITYYGADCVGCSGVTASGTIPEIGRTIAVDPSIPPGSIIRIDGVEYIAEDRGGAIKGNIIDVFAGTEAEATLLGTHQSQVYIKKGENQ